MLMVANRAIAIPPSRFIRTICVSGGFDAADDYIVQNMRAGDLVITSDIPLASKVIEKAGMVINTRGECYDQNNIGEKLALRNFMADMRDSGLLTGGASSMAAKDVQNFANALDRLLQTI